MAAKPARLQNPGQLTFDQTAQLKTAIIVAGFVAVFWNLLDFIPPLGVLTYAWLYEADWSHGPLIPLFGAYLVHTKWERIRRCRVRHTWVGLIVMLVGLAGFLLALSGQLNFGYAKPFSMMVTLFGVIVLLCGLPVMYYVWLPWLYVFFAIPLPQRLYFAWTNPLRRIAAEVASAVLGFLPGLHIERIGSNLEYVYRGMSGVIGVADACSGMRSTVTLCAVGVAVACIAERPLWHRIVLVLACVPIATFCNFIRVTITCYLHIFVDPKYATGQYHMMLGLVVIGLAFGIFSAIGWILNHLFVEAPEADASA